MALVLALAWMPVVVWSVACCYCCERTQGHSKEKEVSRRRTQPGLLPCDAHVLFTHQMPALH